MGTQYYGPGKSRGVANGPSGTAPPGLPGHALVVQRPHGASLTGPPAASLIPTAPQRRMSQCPDSGQGGDTVHKGLCSRGTPRWQCRQAVPGLDFASVWMWSGRVDTCSGRVSQTQQTWLVCISQSHRSQHATALSPPSCSLR